MGVALSQKPTGSPRTKDRRCSISTPCQIRRNEHPRGPLDARICNVRVLLVRDLCLLLSRFPWQDRRKGGGACPEQIELYSTIGAAMGLVDDPACSVPI